MMQFETWQQFVFEQCLTRHIWNKDKTLLQITSNNDHCLQYTYKMYYVSNKEHYNTFDSEFFRDLPTE